jgi:twitching motility protein PilJ
MALELGTSRKKRSKSAGGSKDDAAFRPSEFAPPSGEDSLIAPLAPSPSPRAAPLTRRLSLANPDGGKRTAAMIDRFLDWKLPVIGDRPIGLQIQVLLILLVLTAVVLAGTIALDRRQAATGAIQIELTGDTLMHTQRLARSAPYALEGSRQAFEDLRDSRDRIDANVEALTQGDRTRGLSAATATIQPALARLADRWRATQAASSAIAAQEKAVLQFGDVVKRINTISPRLLQLTEEIAAAKLERGASAREIAASGQLVMLTQRMGRSANAIVAGEGANAELALTLGRDINLFRDLTAALLQGSDSLRIAPASDPETRARLQELSKVYGEFHGSVGGALANLQAISQAKDAELTIVREAEPLRQEVTALQKMFQKEQTERTFNFWALVFFTLAALLLAVAIAKVLLSDTRRRAAEAESERAQAQRLEEEAKRTNEQNQAAILRLMNELQEVADGNLTVQATVTEDITGAIADSVNYTVEELRGLVGRINNTAEQVNNASTAARDIATRLLTASEQQSREIKDTGEKVLKMASQINEVSRSAGESAKVARNSLEAAERGQRAVYNQIAGMNEIREQIQETAKRIKRLGESSQEIGEIVELISDITEQTNVLALNAAIQAASAGEAGRGFSVVAEEVQRLADRSAEAAKQIGALVRTIQTDTQDAVAAMEKSTQGVVEGTKLSDAAGTALADIGRVSRQLAELIERIAGNTNEQAQSAGGVAQSIERILSVTDQTSQGTRQAAQSIGQLATLARELKSSVARFRVG